ncbi:H-NS family nucleoid-associated regulatory protein [Pseudidiomarina terrestris]|uniref:DNA-binding protein n=1 Tax=Pseudidiomarina terrestris TaxID=2820060 RepID=A0AAW7QTN1_9GAMM|nr:MULTISPECIES: H-NS family nucleoid-associated regulatory protein [unclassified Pseudidiomarina]MDN7123517.1 H-NS histone family protein [Pseudidiomarina sp. 1APP75-32.1]MDN7126693.1 H-NS histone family protein [Pseudidiomarina sp. 1APR75-33.1]MDN7128759.1 H-NS histone family protein [Pseudidiomarina sp. 1APR75-15]MDN7134982.1 H-NS histone family protein [Pseudidiomarina sp. 1ASP75-5]MDN7137653.1 H-NS histone family protein [Pseudidiomarina sp. 1ASP75-14]
MSDFLDILTHGRRLKAAVKELSIAELESVEKKLAKVIEDRREEEAELKQQEAEKQRKIQELRKAMDDAGIGLNDLVDGPLPSAKKKQKRAPKPPKYAIIGANGERVTWTGQGRMPNALKDALAQGDNLDKYLIK